MRARIVLWIEEGSAGIAGHLESPDEGLENLCLSPEETAAARQGWQGRR